MRLVAARPARLQTFGMIQPAAALYAAAALAAITPARAQAPKSWPEFTRAFQAYVDSDHVVGASVVYVGDGRVVHWNRHTSPRDAASRSNPPRESPVRFRR